MESVLTKAPFEEKELTPKYLCAARPGLPQLPVFSGPISSRENYLRLFHKDGGEKPLWIPLANEIVNLAPSMIPDNVARSFVIEGKPFNPMEGGGPDMFGTEWVYVPVAGGSMVRPGAPRLCDAGEWREKIPFPDIEAWDWEGSATLNREFLNNDRPILVWFLTGLYERLISYMDFADAAVAMIDEEQKDAVKELLENLTDLYLKIFEKFIRYYHMNILYFHDDWGSQTSPFFSLETVREMLVPSLKRITSFCHEHGVIFEFHCCGKVEKLVPAMIESGMDVWCGQPMNDKAMLHEKYGKDIVLGIEEDTLPLDATDEACHAAAKKFVDQYGPLMDTAPVYCNLRNCPAKQVEETYILARKMLGG